MKGTLRATEAWIDAHRAEDDKYVELDYELAVVLGIVTDGAARSTVLKVAHVEPSHRFVAWQALVDGCAPKSSKDPAVAPQSILATPRSCKDAEDVGGEGNDAEGHQARVPDGTEEMLMNLWKNWRSSSTK